MHYQDINFPIVIIYLVQHQNGIDIEIKKISRRTEEERVGEKETCSIITKK